MKSTLIKTSSLMAASLLVSVPAFASPEAVAQGGEGMGLIGLAAGIAVGLAALGSGMGQGRIAGSALEGMSRNPQAGGDIRTAMLIALAFPESLVLFAFAISFLLLSGSGIF